uniref:Uncharacterized protein n=1 Tax=Aegilops tauschii subsp. strangulata TaxID=200361 RepID=A0A453KWR5_AEGTS
QPALGGNANTAIICNITLAQRSMQMRLKAACNLLVGHYVLQIVQKSMRF